MMKKTVMVSTISAAGLLALVLSFSLEPAVTAVAGYMIARRWWAGASLRDCAVDAAVPALVAVAFCGLGRGVVLYAALLLPVVSGGYAHILRRGYIEPYDEEPDEHTGG